MRYNVSELVEKETSISVDLALPLSDLDLAFFFNYQIFPDNIMGSYTQWKDEQRSMQVGDTIVQQAYLPPNPVLSQKIIFGVRISEIIEEENRIGYSYETLEGHVEKGISTFTIERHNNRTIFKIHTYSKPGSFLTRLVGPIFSIPYQTYCTKKCLKNVKAILER